MVLALMAMLAFLGLFFYDFVQVEANTAENFSQVVEPLGGIDPESLINSGLQSIIVHPDDEAVDQGSVLDGGKASLLSHILGTIKKSGSVLKPHDYELRNGRGIRVIQGSPVQFVYSGSDAHVNDMSLSPSYPRTSNELVLNRSAAANTNTMTGNGERLDIDPLNPLFEFEPDVGYTYPDLNPIFLSIEYLQSEDTNNNGIQDGGETDLNGSGAWNANDFITVVKPSFMDPSVFLAINNNTADWYNAASTKRWMFRPHKSHLIPGTTTARFVVDEFPEIKATGTALALGPWTSNGKNYGGLDVDADANGVRDSIYVDLGLKPQTLADGSGRVLVPMSFWKIEDLNGLIDLNAAGNIADIIYKNRTDGAKTAIDLSTPTTVDLIADVYNSGGSNRSIHYSHYGLSRAEVNPAWALWAVPPTASDGRTRWNVAFYRSTTNATFTRQQMQNTELAMLLMGSSVSMEQSISTGYSFTDNLDDLQGRYGDANRILNTPTGNYATAGDPNTDEDLGEDVNNNGILDTGEDVNGNGILDGYAVPRGIHPTDSFGTGGINIDVTARGARQLTLLPGGQIPMPGYNGRWQAQPATMMGQNYRDLSLGGSLLLPPVTGAAPAVVDLRPDDPGEVNRYSYTFTERDNLFRPTEIAALHLSDFDYTRAAMFSRTRQLAPFNFNMSSFSRNIRQQFTTESWDRREFSFPYDPNRNFEFNDADGNNFRFPPKSLNAGVSRHELGTIVNNDPFRPVVRRLLTTFSIRDTNPPLRNRANFPQLPLELNRILDENGTVLKAFDSNGNPNFRQLTPHPNLRTASTSGTVEPETVHHNNIDDVSVIPPIAAGHPVRRYNLWGTTPGDPTAPYVQEWWARYDRQRLARDIYVLLAVLCNPTATNPMTTPMDPAVAKEMAQFAVNYVDAFDPDDVITRFEYDPDLSDGWNLTPSYYSSNQYFVNGVEAQQLTLSEALWIKQKKNMGAVNGTLHKEGKGHHEFLYVELRNGTPFNVDLRQNTWRLVRLDPTLVTPTMDPTVQTNHLASVAFRSTTKYVSGGANFVIAGHDGNVVNESDVPISSDYYADTNGDGTTLEPVVPGAGPTTTASATPDPLCDLDLCHSRDAMEFDLVAIGDPANSAGSATMKTANNLVPKLLYFDTDAEEITTNPNADRMVLSLQRRRNLWTDGNITNTASAPGANDWVEVDRLDFTMESNNRVTIGSDAAIVTELPKLRSRERYHHLDERNEAAVVAPAPPAMGSRAFLVNHSIYQPYSVNATNAVKRNTIATEDMLTDMTNVYNTVWQPHHDRDLTSTYEMLSIPVVGPGQLVERIRDHASNVNVAKSVNGWSNSTTFLPYAAAIKFLPRYQATQPPDVIPWTRLLNFVALPDPTDRVQQKINPNYVRSRTFGQININTLRTPPVLEGLIDDPRMIDANTPGLKNNPGLATERYWWNDFKSRRDGGPGNGMGGLSSVPFLPPGQFNVDPTRPADGVERGMARHREILTGANSKFGLFEARDLADVVPTEDLSAVDLHTRYRLLQKIANNTTNRSHMFAIWGGLDFFEGTETSTGSGQFRVGAKATDVQTCRWFFIVDMTRLEEAFNTTDNSFDWRKFVIYRQRLE